MKMGKQKPRAMRLWLAALVACAGGVFLSLTSIHFAQQHLAADDARTIEIFRQASEDLVLGVLHVALAGVPDAPWQQAQGLALVEQGMDALAAVSADLALGEPTDGLHRALERLRTAVRADRSVAVLGDPRLPAAIHAAHSQARAVEQALNLRAASRARGLNQAFAWTLAVSLILLTGSAIGFLRSVRARDQAVAEVADRDARHGQTLAALFEGVLSFDAHGAPTSVNPAAERLLGLSLAQGQEQHRHGQGWGLTDADGKPLSSDALPWARVLATGGPVSLSASTLPSPGREPSILEVNAVPLHEAGTARVVGVVASLRDVSDERQAALALAEYQLQLEAEVRQRSAELTASLAAQRDSDAFVRAIADHQDSLVAYYDHTLTLRFANQAFFEWMGLQRDDALGKPMHEVLGVEEADLRRTSALRALAGETILEPRVEFKGADGRVGQFRAHRRPDFREDQVRGYYLTATNITEIVAAGERLEVVNRALTAERDRAESATRAKSAFLANMSHEIRTPMNAIVRLTRQMQRRSAEGEFRGQIDKVAGAAEHLLRLLNDILDLSKIEAGELHLEQVPFDFQDMVRQNLELIRPAAQARNLELQADLPNHLSTLVGDPTRLSQALLNLLGNAVKFTETGGVRLAVTAQPVGDSELLLRFEVHDSGIGVDDTTLARLFKPFLQADVSTTRRYGGTGLGLTITREIAQRMGGEAGGRGTPGVGSTFWFSARLRADSRAVATEAAPARSEEQLSLRGCRVLLAEDNPINQEVAVSLLEDFGAIVEVAADGAQAVAAAASGTFDIVLMDMQMPGMDGLEATRKIRGLPSGGRLPIIAMTANAFQEDRQLCLQAGMNDHLAKPVVPDELHRTLLRWFASRQVAAAERTNGSTGLT